MHFLNTDEITLNFQDVCNVQVEKNREYEKVIEFQLKSHRVSVYDVFTIATIMDEYKGGDEITSNNKDARLFQRMTMRL